MSLARRLIATGGGASIVSLAVESVLSPPNFFWSIVCDPIAVHHNGVTYCTGATDADGGVHVVAYDHATETAGSVVTLATGLSSFSGNIHNGIAIYRLTSGKLIAAYCEEEGDMFVRISTNADDITAWDSPITVGSGAYTFMSVYQLPDVVNDPIYIFTRRDTGSDFTFGYFKSTDGGATWGSFTTILNITGYKGMYWRLGSDQSTTLHIFVTDTDRADGDPSSVYHFRFVGDALQKSDGTSVSIPAAVTSGTLVQDDSDNAARPEGWAMWNGHPCVLVKSSETDRDPSVVRSCVWNGSSWDKYTVGTFGATFYTAMSKDNPFNVYVSEYDGSRYQVWRYHSNTGASWSGRKLTSTPGAENGAPDTPLNAAYGMRAIWGQGTGLTDSGWSYGLHRSSI